MTNSHIKLHPEENRELQQCKYCNQSFSLKNNLYRHIKYYCKQNNDESLQEYANLLNALNSKDKQIDHIQKQMDILIKNLNIQNVNLENSKNTIINGDITTNINVNLLNYNETDYSHLTHRDYITCIKDCNHCVKTLIEKVHFNRNKPENMNIYVSSIKGNFIMVYRDNKWQVKNRKTQIDDLFDYNELMLENWFRDYHEQYPHIIDSFQRYLKNKEEDDDMISDVKAEILLLLYNERDKVLTTEHV